MTEFAPGWRFIETDSETHKRTVEDEARDMLDAMGVEDALEWSSGEVVYLANLINEAHYLRAAVEALTNALVTEGYSRDAIANTIRAFIDRRARG